jgi:hypothetical protein
MRSKLQDGKLLSSFAFNFNLRRYTKAPAKAQTGAAAKAKPLGHWQGLTLVPISAQRELFRPSYDPT